MKKVNGFYELTIFAKTPFYMFDRFLNMSLNYLSCFVVVLKGKHRNVDIWQN